MRARPLVIIVALVVSACGRVPAPAPSGPLRLLAAGGRPLPILTHQSNPPRTLNLVVGRLRPQGPDTLIVSGEFEVGDSLSARARHSDTLYRRPWTKGTYLTEIPGAHRGMPVVVPWDVHWEGSTLVVSSESGELLGMSGPFRFGPE